MAPNATDLDAALASVSSFATETLFLADDAELTRIALAAETVARQLSAIQVTAAAEMANRSRRELGVDGLAARHGHVGPAPFLEQILRISGAEATRRISLGSALRPGVSMTGEPIAPRCPALAVAVARGEVGPEAAAVIVRALDAVRRVASPDDLDVAEAGLIEHARRRPVQHVSDLAIVVRDRLDPDGIRPREEETRLRRGVTLGRERNGIVPIRGGLEPITAALLRSVFDEANAPAAKPRFLSAADLADGTTTKTNEDGSESIDLRDVRTREQRQHDVLSGLITAGVRNTGLDTGQIRSTAEVVVHVSVDDLESGTGPGHIDGIHESISMGTVERVLCDATYRRIILGNDGEPLAFGKARYPFSAAQRKAIIARDGATCLLCDAPAAWTEAHHVHEFYTHGAHGRTDVDDGVLLCGSHHDFLHHSEWQLSMIGGIPHLLAPPHIDPGQTWKRMGRPSVPLDAVPLRRTG